MVQNLTCTVVEGDYDHVSTSHISDRATYSKITSLSFFLSCLSDALISH